MACGEAAGAVNKLVCSGSCDQLTDGGGAAKERVISWGHLAAVRRLRLLSVFMLCSALRQQGFCCQLGVARNVCTRHIQTRVVRRLLVHGQRRSITRAPRTPLPPSTPDAMLSGFYLGRLVRMTSERAFGTLHVCACSSLVTWMLGASLSKASLAGSRCFSHRIFKGSSTKTMAIT